MSVGEALNGDMPTRGLRTHYKTLHSLSRLTLLHALQTRGGLTIDELATVTGLHINTAREHLHQLITIGLVRAEPQLRGARGRPVLRYLVEASTPAARPGASQAEELGAHMGRCGFNAEIDADGRRMTMRDCPFATLSNENPQVCQVHRALIADALGRAPGPVRAGELRRLVTERECTLELVRERSDTTSSA